MRRCQPTPGRMACTRDAAGGVIVLDDTYNANPQLDGARPRDAAPSSPRSAAGAHRRARRHAGARRDSSRASTRASASSRRSSGIDVLVGCGPRWRTPPRPPRACRQGVSRRIRRAWRTCSTPLDAVATRAEPVASRRRRAGQGLARDGDGARGRRALAEKSEGRRDLRPPLPAQRAPGALVPQRAALRAVPRARGDDDRDAPDLRALPVVHPPAADASRSARSCARTGPRSHFSQGRHADHGRRADPARAGRVHGALGRPAATRSSGWSRR